MSDPVHAIVSAAHGYAPPSAVPTMVLVRDSSTVANVFYVSGDGPTAVSGDADRRVVLWHHTLEKFGAAQLNARFRAATRAPMDSDAWVAWFSMKILVESALRTRSTDASVLDAFIASGAFDGHKGIPLRFDARHQLVQPMYAVSREGRGGQWRVVSEIAADGAARPH